MQVVDRGRPDLIMLLTVSFTVCPVVGAVDTHTVAEYMRFTVGDVLPTGKIRVMRLTF